MSWIFEDSGLGEEVGRGVGWGEEKRTFPHTESSNSKAVESGNMDMEKQTVQSGRGVECMKGMRKAAVVLGTHRQPASNKWRVNQPFHSAEGERLLPRRWP